MNLILLRQLQKVVEEVILIYTLYAQYANSFSSCCFGQLRRCLEKYQMTPPENPLFCLYSDQKNDTLVIQCCKEYDHCNRDLKPALHVRREGMFLDISTKLYVLKNLRMAG